MHIVLNASILRAPRTGIGQYIAGLSSAIVKLTDTQIDFFAGLSWSAQPPPSTMPGYSRISTLAKRYLPNAYSLRRNLQQKAFNHGVKRLRPALYHEPSLWPLEFAGPMVMTLHDLTHVHYPETQPADRLREIEKRVEPALARAQVILTDSQFIADEAQRYYGIAPERLRVAPLGYAERFRPYSATEQASVCAELGIAPGQYLLCVGTLEPRKNLPLALDAYAQLPEAVRQRYPLLIAGMAGWGPQALQGRLGTAVSSGQVRLLGYLDDQRLAQVLAGARMLLFPSLYEGFGLPVLEAMAAGVPVVLSATASLPEVAGTAGTYCPAEAPQQWSTAIMRLIEDDREWLLRRRLGLEQVQQFSWANCARITTAAYRQALE
ncbi:glycosyltransferase family 4 protein [Pseudomonas sp. 5P_3.1_Bac2]|uniref:glycosyltransferase family 4 protein n=1 Tax=Pseudomonas sp. 5P_3.1_Bac2 TaxID=2971617 RepID=UPI0021CAD7E7|nr:glycosyltransferase family 1 protein [Pseudomonas sp. 5P_3.1_Bac2]MCU1719249.1 glycosyltransferase family 4 protein [Pseudomonas sp. 5P_3.1_Bac2]